MASPRPRRKISRLPSQGPSLRYVITYRITYLMELDRRFRWCCFLGQTAFYETGDFHNNKRFRLLRCWRNMKVRCGIKREPFMPVNLASPLLPTALFGIVSVNPFGVPRFWATIWSDVLNPSLEPSTRRKHLAATDRLYQAERSRSPPHGCPHSFVTEMLRYAVNTSGARAAEIEAKVLRLETLYRQLVPNPETPPLPIRAAAARHRGPV